MNKTSIIMRVAVHKIKADLWLHGCLMKNITKNMTLRDIGQLIEVSHPQQIKHHLDAMVKMGSIDMINGQYVFPAPESESNKEIKRLLGVASWASGKLLDAGDVEAADEVLRKIGKI